MKFLIDQDLYATTSAFLKNPGHDVVKATDRGLARAPDRELLRNAHVDERVLVTRDKDFGALSFLEAKASSGVISNFWLAELASQKNSETIPKPSNPKRAHGRPLLGMESPAFRSFEFRPFELVSDFGF